MKKKLNMVFRFWSVFFSVSITLAQEPALISMKQDSSLRSPVEKNSTYHPYGGNSSSSPEKYFKNTGAFLLEDKTIAFDPKWDYLLGEDEELADSLEFPVPQKLWTPIELAFEGYADFFETKFDSVAFFTHSWFGNIADFGGTNFTQLAIFTHSNFDTLTSFKGADFHDRALFTNTRFGGDTHFSRAVFQRFTDFRSASFDKLVEFDETSFKSLIHFDFAVFKGRVSFVSATFERKCQFSYVIFNDVVDFRNTRFDTVSFTRTAIKGRLLLGSPSIQRFDLRRATFYPKSKIELYDLVDLTIHPEKLRRITFGDTINYFLKTDIIGNLKEMRFQNDRWAQLELDYILAKSTMYQEHTDTYLPNKWYQVWKWPKWCIAWLYYWTMGLGFRPFRLIYWVLAVIIIFTGYYVKKMGRRVNAYIAMNFSDESNSSLDDKKKKFLSLGMWETSLNCVYFSALLFFTFRLRGNILTFFDGREKRIIISEWLLGFLVYVAFLTLSKSGSPRPAHPCSPGRRTA